jgi:hypothetical protein
MVLGCALGEAAACQWEVQYGIELIQNNPTEVT